MILPVLDSRFFIEQAPGANFFQKWKEKGPWNSQLVPLYEWNNILFIGTDSTDHRLTFDFPHVLVQANADDLSHLWNIYQGQPQAYVADDSLLQDEAPPIFTDAAPAPMDAPEGLDFQVSPPSFSEITQAKSTPVESIPAESSTVGAQQQDEEWSIPIFDKLNSHFPYSILFLAAGNQAMPWKWSSSLTTTQPLSIDMTKPSPFYVIHRTLQSFHGPIAHSEVILSLCQNWNIKSEPQHIILSPILTENKLFGIVAVLGDSELNQPSHLSFCESIAEEISQVITEAKHLPKTA